MKKQTQLREAGTGRALGTLLLLLVAVLTLGACDSLLNVDAPSRVPSDKLDDPANAPLLLNGAIGDFECAFGAYVVLGGIIGDELIDATQTADRWPYDRRDVQASDRRYGESSCVNLGVYSPLSTARWDTENLLSKLNGWTDAQVANRAAMMTTAQAYSGYAHLLLGEGFCEGVLLDANLQAGGISTRAEVLQRAEERFTQAITSAQAAGNADILNMALVGRARTRLDLGNRAGAAADARLVTANYVKNATASTVATTRENRVNRENNTSTNVSVGVPYRGLTFGGVADPRVNVTDTGKNASDGTRIWVQNKYPTLASPIPLATWTEAQLIIAEVDGGQTAVGIINALHRRAGLPDFASTDAAAIQRQVIEERRRELFLDGHHLGDVLRYNLALTPAAGTAYPKGGSYGNAACLPLPNIERLNNPKIGA